MVGFILMKVSSFSQRVKPPKTIIIHPVTIGIIGSRLSIRKERASTTSVAMIIAAVAAYKSANQYVTKKTIIGPYSTAAFNSLGSIEAFFSFGSSTKFSSKINSNNHKNSAQNKKLKRVFTLIDLP